MREEMMRRDLLLQQPHIKAKIIGTTLIIIGIVFLFISSSLYIKLGFAALLIGFFIIIIITEKSVPQIISNAQIEGNADAVKQITKELNLKGNVMFIPKSDILTEERVFIPLQNMKVSLPDIDNDFVFSTGNDGKSLGLVLPPSGLKLLHEVEKEVDFENTDIDHIEEKLQTFVGMDILKSVSLKKTQDQWKLEVGNPAHCTQNSDFCKQYPCPSCSALLSAITKASKQKIQVEDTVHNGKKTTFFFTMEG
jgi:hypothetical protein